MTHGEMNGRDDPNRGRRLCRTAGLLAVLLALGGTFLPRAARAREIAATEADLGGRVRVSVLSEADGVFVAIERSGGPPVRQRLPLSAPASSIVAEATTVELTGGRAVHVTARAGGHVVEALVALGPPGPDRRARIAWADRTDLSGDRGERRGHRLSFADRTGDGRADAVVYDVDESVSLCGVAEAPLSPHAYDPASGLLRPVAVDRLAGLAAPSARLTLAVEPDAPVAPALRVATFVSSSSDARAPGTAPRALDDGDPATAWSEGVGGDGRWEFVTAAIDAGPFAITGIRVNPVPIGQPRRWNRPRRLTLTLRSAASSVTRVELVFARDPVDAPGQTWGVLLPAPVAARCASLVIEEVYAAGAPGGGTTSLAEVALLTELDTRPGGAIEAVRAALGEHGEMARSAARVAGQFEDPVLAAIAQSWDRVVPEAREALVRSLGVRSTAAARELRLRALGDPDAAVGSAAAAALARSHPSEVSLYRTVLESGADALVRRRVAALLGAIGTYEAVEALIARAARGERGDVSGRRAIRQALASAVRQGPPSVAVQVHLALGGETPLERKIDVAFALAAGDARLGSFVAEAWRQARGFGERYRLLVLADRARAAALVPMLAEVAQHDEDEILRAAAIEAIESLPGAGYAVGAALGDPAVRVRLAAARASALAPAPLGSLRGAARTDRWPAVRAAALRSLVVRRDPAAPTVTLVLLGDPSASVRREALDQAGDDAHVLRGVAALFARSGERTDLRERAAAILGDRCAATHEVLDALTSAVRAQAEADVDEGVVRVAASATEALGRIGGARALEAIGVAARSNASAYVRTAAARALGAYPGSEADGMLAVLARDGAPAVRQMALQAERNRSRGRPSRCSPRSRSDGPRRSDR